MSARTWTLDEIHMAYNKRGGPYWPDLESALLAAKPNEAPLSEDAEFWRNTAEDRQEIIEDQRTQLATRDARIAELERKILRALGCLSEELK